MAPFQPDVCTHLSPTPLGEFRMTCPGANTSIVACPLLIYIDRQKLCSTTLRVRKSYLPTYTHNGLPMLPPRASYKRRRRCMTYLTTIQYPRFAQRSQSTPSGASTLPVTSPCPLTPSILTTSLLMPMPAMSVEISEC